jgi:hypothetical protein
VPFLCRLGCVGRCRGGVVASATIPFCADLPRPGTLYVRVGVSVTHRALPGVGRLLGDFVAIVPQLCCVTQHSAEHEL